MAKPCITCNAKLESAVGGWKTMQPYGGGEVQFIFSYGSTKFDDDIGATVFRGVICDDCASKIVNKMKRVNNANRKNPSKQ